MNEEDVRKLIRRELQEVRWGGGGYGRRSSYARPTPRPVVDVKAREIDRLNDEIRQAERVLYDLEPSDPQYARMEQAIDDRRLRIKELIAAPVTEARDNIGAAALTKATKHVEAAARVLKSEVMPWEDSPELYDAYTSLLDAAKKIGRVARKG